MGLTRHGGMYVSGIIVLGGLAASIPMGLPVRKDLKLNPRSVWQKVENRDNLREL